MRIFRVTAVSRALAACRERRVDTGPAAGFCLRSRRLPRCPTIPVEMLRARHDAQGYPCTRGGWLGERLDMGYAIDVVHPLAAGAAMPRRSEGAGRGPR